MILIIFSFFVLTGVSGLPLADNEEETKEATTANHQQATEEQQSANTDNNNQSTFTTSLDVGAVTTAITNPTAVDLTTMLAMATEAETAEMNSESTTIRMSEINEVTVTTFGSESISTVAVDTTTVGADDTMPASATSSSAPSLEMGPTETNEFETKPPEVSDGQTATPPLPSFTFAVTAPNSTPELISQATEVPVPAGTTTTAASLETTVLEAETEATVPPQLMETVTNSGSGEQTGNVPIDMQQSQEQPSSSEGGFGTMSSTKDGVRAKDEPPSSTVAESKVEQSKPSQSSGNKDMNTITALTMPSADENSSGNGAPKSEVVPNANGVPTAGDESETMQRNEPAVQTTMVPTTRAIEVAVKTSTKMPETIKTKTNSPAVSDINIVHELHSGSINGEALGHRNCYPNRQRQQSGPSSPSFIFIEDSIESDDVESSDEGEAIEITGTNFGNSWRPIMPVLGIPGVEILESFICTKSGYYQHPTECDRFLQCERDGQMPFVVKCGEETYWDNLRKTCGWSCVRS